MQLAEVTRLLEALAPLQLAEEWDNVGLILASDRAITVERLLLTIDLTDAVMREAVETGVDLIVAYHPPVFSGLRRVVGDTLPERVVVQAIRHGIAVYSPHTALDSVASGVNDWLCGAFGPGQREPLEARPFARSSSEGAGRRVRLDQALPLDMALTQVKRHLGLSSVRVARAGSPQIQEVLVCAGAGGALLAGKPGDLYLTGEMRHHDILAANARGTSVILTDHTNCERGFLPILAERLGELTAAAPRRPEIRISQSDRDPLEPA